MPKALKLAGLTLEDIDRQSFFHPNTDLRVYAVNAEIGGDETSKQLLAEFIGKRLEIQEADQCCRTFCR